MRKVTCLYCGNIFETKHSTKKYCSRSHKVEQCKKRQRLARRIEKECEYCGRKYKTSRSRQRFCCKECTGKSLTAKSREIICACCGVKFTTKGNRSKYCSYKCLRAAYKFSKHLRNKSCECCGFGNKHALHLHHINRTKKIGYVTLCANCHYIYHGVAGRKRKQYERDTKQEVIDIINNELNEKEYT